MPQELPITTTCTRRGRHLAGALTTAGAHVLHALSIAANAARAQIPPPNDTAPYTHPQRLLEVAPGRQSNLHGTGYGSPTVVLDAGFGNSA